MKNWIISNTVCIGSSHSANQLPCQDALDHICTSEIVLAVTADGVGSLCNSQIAAETAATHTVSWFQQNYYSLRNPSTITAEIRQSLIPYLQKQIAQRAQLSGLDLETMDCNLSFACILPKFDYAVWGVLGDGAVCVLCEDHQYVLSAVNALSANSTETVLQDRAESSFRLETCKLSESQLVGFLVTSDGLEGEIFDKNSTFLRSNAMHYFNAMLHSTETERNAAVRALLDRLPPELDDDISLSIISDASRSQPLTLSAPPTWLCTCSNRNTLDHTICTRCNTSLWTLYPGVNSRAPLEVFFRNLNQDPLQEQALLRQSSAEFKPNTVRPRRTAGGGSRVSGEQQIPPPKTTPSKPKAVRNIKNVPPRDLHHVRNEPDVRAHSSTVFPAAVPAQPSEYRHHPKPNVYPEKSAFFSHSSFVTLVIACIAAVWMIFLSFSLFHAHQRISSLERLLSTSQHQTSAPSSAVSYTVSKDSAQLLLIENGQISHGVGRLNKGDILKRLDDKQITIDGVNYIQVLTADNKVGWCNLNALTQTAP